MDAFVLPKGWKSRTVGEICGKPQYGYTASARIQPVGPKFLRITDIQDGKVDWDVVPYCVCDEIEKYTLQSGDILFVRTGATTGKSFLVKNPPPAVFASYLIRIHQGEEVLPEYLHAYFQSPFYWAAVASGVVEGNRPNMNGTKLAKLKIAFPEDKQGQHRIVSWIEAFIQGSEEVIQEAKIRESELDNLIQSMYSQMIADTEWRPLGTVATLLRRKVEAKPEQRYEEMGVRSFGKGTFRKPVLTGEQIGKKRIYRVHEGDLVFNNVFAWEGAIAVAQRDDHGRVGSHRFITYVPKEKQATSEFLCRHFLSPRGLEDIGTASPGSAGRNRTLGLEKLDRIMIPVPDFSEQVRFEQVAKIRKEVARISSESMQELKKLIPSIVAKAFNGEL